MSGLPKQVQAQLDAALALEKEMTAVDHGNTDTTKTAPPPTAEQPGEAGSASQVPTATDQQQPQPAGDDVQKKLQDLDHKLSVLQGKYNAEIPRANQRVRELEAENEALRRQATQAQAQASQATNEAERIKRLIPKEAMDEFGENLMTANAKVAQAAIEEAVAPIRQQMEQSRDQAFFDTLDKAAPNWREVNQEGTGFFEWLGEVDPFSGLPRQALLDRAFAQRDAARLAAFVKTFMAIKDGNKPSAPPAPTSASNQNDNLRRQVAPSKSAATTPPSATPKVYTPEEYNTLTRRVIAGAFSPAETAKLKTELDAAFTEGRIRITTQ